MRVCAAPWLVWFLCARFCVSLSLFSKELAPPSSPASATYLFPWTLLARILDRPSPVSAPPYLIFYLCIPLYPSCIATLLLYFGRILVYLFVLFLFGCLFG
ncbi:hypothetical protein DFH11DRAFT_1621102 [Phellopilus nigrolimitatus]|nr:hypothetical protein DFH11DRAFT_1621102 [Phellopilus nigrolimitatus]